MTASETLDLISKQWCSLDDLMKLGQFGRNSALKVKREIKEIRIHDFRHSCASLLINNGANITIVAKYLGHTKIDETLNTYSHMYKNKLNDVVDTINKLI